MLGTHKNGLLQKTYEDVFILYWVNTVRHTQISYAMHTM